VVLYSRRTRERHVLRRWLHSREQSQLDRPTRVCYQVEELMNLIEWSRLDGQGVVGNFLRRRVLPCQRRVHTAYEYQGSQDSTRMHKDNLEKLEVQRQINELFNLADSSFVRSNNWMHAYKLGRPAPKVRNYSSCNFANCCSLTLKSYCCRLAVRRHWPSNSVCITGARYGAPGGGGPADGQRCSVLPIHQQRGGW